MATVFLFAGDRDYFNTIDDWFTAKNMALAKNLTARGLLFLNMRQRADGTVAYKLYGRFPIGAFVLIKLAIAPFEGDSAAQLAAARALMLAFFCAAAALAYLALARLSGSRAVALGATLLAFSSHHLLHWRDATKTTHGCSARAWRSSTLSPRRFRARRSGSPRNPKRSAGDS